MQPRLEQASRPALEFFAVVPKKKVADELDPLASTEAARRLLGMLRRAERLAPQRIRSSKLAKAVIGDMIGGPMSRSDERELRGMAYRAGVPH